MLDHQLPHHREDAEASSLRPYACPVPDCGRSFKRRFTLKEHVKTHTGEKSFTCPVPSCRKSFTTSGNLSRHKRLHPWLETTFECLIVGCGCTFASETKLERHMSMAHFGMSTHLCPRENCGGAFSTAGNLKRHLRHHHSGSEAASSPVKAEPTPSRRAETQRIVYSPVAVDRFDGPKQHSHDVTSLDWFMPPPAFLHTAPAQAAPLASDRELLEALGCLFESDAYFGGSAVV